MKDLDKIKELPISNVISLYIPLNRRGDLIEARCPFHSGTEQSFKVSDGKGLFKCFVCGAGGDAIRFVMDYRRISFTEAINEISSRMLKA